MSAISETGVLNERLPKEPQFYEYEKDLLALDFIGISLLLVLLAIIYARCQQWEFKERKLQVLIANFVSTELLVAVCFRKELVEWFVWRGFLLLIYVIKY